MQFPTLSTQLTGPSELHSILSNAHVTAACYTTCC